MTNTLQLACDGCGLPADSGHIAKRLQRLEWTTRYRPLHIQTLFLSGVSPLADGEFLYAPVATFQGEALRLLETAGISPAGKTREAVHVEFQRAGFFLTHVLECPWGETSQQGTTLPSAIERRSSAVVRRIRRSLKPRRVALISQLLAPLASKFSTSQMECQVVLDGELPFGIDGSDSSAAVNRLRQALSAAPAIAR
jgi:hypothetical protein